jgi:pimeloyl-ACP methyl ester carboxylesterase/DNA-binding CsgD family transcriptional regulator
MAASRPGAATPLSEREQQIAQFYIEGRTHKEIARSLAIAPSTVRTHLNTIYRKLEVTSRIELLRRFSCGPPALADLRHRPARGARSLAVGGHVSADLPGTEIDGPLRRLGLNGCAWAAASAIDDALLRTLIDEKLKAIGIDVLRATSLLDDGLAEAARTQFVAIHGKRIAYRSVGEDQPVGVPIVFLHRFRASMDDWDPALVNALARDRRVILFDNVGVGESDGQTPGNLEQMTDDAASFVRALGLTEVDILGWSMGGMIGQILAAKHPDLVRKLALIGTLPPGCWGGSPEVVVQCDWERVARKPTWTDEDLLYLFFSPSLEGVAAGLASIGRTSFRREACEIKTGPETMHAQYQAAISFFRNEGDWYEKLQSIQAPTLVAAGDNDPTFPTIDLVVLAREIPQAQLAIYPDAGHGFHFQYPDRFAADLRAFLRR